MQDRASNAEITVVHIRLLSVMYFGNTVFQCIATCQQNNDLSAKNQQKTTIIESQHCKKGNNYKSQPVKKSTLFFTT